MKHEDTFAQNVTTGYLFVTTGYQVLCSGPTLLHQSYELTVQSVYEAYIDYVNFLLLLFFIRYIATKEQFRPQP